MAESDKTEPLGEAIARREREAKPGPQSDPAVEAALGLRNEQRDRHAEFDSVWLKRPKNTTDSAEARYFFEAGRQSHRLERERDEANAEASDGPDGPEDFCAARESSYTDLFIGRPQLERVCGNLGVAPRLDHLASGVWLAVLHDPYEDYVSVDERVRVVVFPYRIQVTGGAPAQAMDRLEKLLADIDRA